MAPLAKMTPLSSPLFIFFYFSPVPRLLDISNELLLSYSTVTAFFLANGFLHASSPPPPLAFSLYVSTLSSPLFFPPHSLLLVFVLQKDFAIRHRTQDALNLPCKVNYASAFSHVFREHTEEGREKKKKKESWTRSSITNEKKSS